MNKIAIILVILVLALPCYPALAQECDPEPEWINETIPVSFGVEQRGAFVEVKYDPEFYSLNFEFHDLLSWDWLVETIAQDNTGINVQITRPLDYQQAQTVYLIYYAYGYAVSDECEAARFEKYIYRAYLPLVIDD